MKSVAAITEGKSHLEQLYKLTTESGNNFIRLNDEGKTHLKNAALIPEVEFLITLAHRLLGDYPVDWRELQNPKYVRHSLARTILGFEKMATINDTKEEFRIGGRILTEPGFSTPSGKASMFVTPLPELTLPDAKDFGASESTQGIVLALITGRSYSQFNTVVYKIGDQYRGMPHRNCILMNRIDAESAGLQAHQSVTMQGDASKMENVEIIYGSIRQGAAFMFYPK